MDFVELNKKFRDIGRTLGSVESFTGGLFAHEVTKVPHASRFYKGGLITYSTEEKNRLLGIGYDLIDEHGVISQECAAVMAGRGKSLLNVDYCVAFTGNAGPDAMEGKKVGEVYIAVAAYDVTKAFSYQLTGTREEIQQQAINIACELLVSILEEKR